MGRNRPAKFGETALSSDYIEQIHQKWILTNAYASKHTNPTR